MFKGQAQRQRLPRFYGLPKSYYYVFRHHTKHLLGILRFILFFKWSCLKDSRKTGIELIEFNNLKFLKPLFPSTLQGLGKFMQIVLMQETLKLESRNLLESFTTLIWVKFYTRPMILIWRLKNSIRSHYNSCGVIYSLGSNPQDEKLAVRRLRNW